MTLPLPSSVSDPATQQNFDKTAEQFPIQAANIAKEAVGPTALKKESVTDEKLAKPTIVGVVEAGGAIKAGSGFTVTHSETGRYTVKLATAAATLLVPIATLMTPATTNLQIEITGTPGKQEFLVSTYVVLGALANSGFTFHVKAS